MLNEALNLLQQGFSVVAARRDDKRPISNWTEFQKRLPTEDELKRWFLDDPNANLGFITGTVSGFFVIDFESSVDIETFKEYKKLPHTAIARTGSGGLHYYYRCPGNVIIPTGARIFGRDSKWEVDVRGEGGFVLAPPSIHPISKTAYKWLFDLKNLSPAPDWIIEWANSANSFKNESTAQETKIWEQSLEGSDQGIRNVSMTSFVGLLMKKNPVSVWDTVIPPAMQKLNSKNNPPLPNRELSIIYNSIKKKELARRQADGETDEEELPQQEEQIQPISVQELLDKPIPELLWVVERLIPLNGITILSSPPGFYKTWVLLEIVLKVILKSKVFGEFNTIQEDAGILVVNEENWEGMIQMRLKSMLSDEDTDKLKNLKANLLFYNEAGIQLNLKTVNKLIALCKNKNIKLIVFDSLSSVNNFDENSSTEIKKLFDQLKLFKRDGISVLMTHHHRKESIFRPTNPSENMRGSTNILAQLDSHLILAKKRIESEDFIIFYQGKARLQKETEPFKVDIINEDDSMKFIHAGNFTEDDMKKSVIEHFKGDVAKFIDQNSGCVIEQIIQAFRGKIGSKNIREILKILQTDNHIFIDGKKPKKYFTLPQSEEILAEEAFNGNAEVDSE